MTVGNNVNSLLGGWTGHSWIMNILMIILIGMIAYQAHQYDRRFDRLEELIQNRPTRDELVVLRERVDRKAEQVTVDQFFEFSQGRLNNICTDLEYIKKELK